MSIVSTPDFVEVCKECDYDAKTISKTLSDRFTDYYASPGRVTTRLGTLRRRGLLPLESGNSVSVGEILKGTTTLYNADGSIKQQYVKTDVPKQQFIEQFSEAIAEIAQTLPALPQIPLSTPEANLEDDLLNVIISNDVHVGLFVDEAETGEGWNTAKANTTLRGAYDHLFDHIPKAKQCIIVDLGDLTEADNSKNVTPKSGNPLDVDGKHYFNLRVAYEALIYAVKRALETHETVYFYNIAGNHDIESGTAIREIIRVAFADNPRVIVSESPSLIKYHQHDQTLLQFAHGDNIKMAQASETMAFDCQDIFSSTTHRFSHFGHTHVDAVKDTKLCRIESHRNIAPLNQWAFSNGYRRGVGTMKAITYHSKKGEVSRQLYNVS